jgi:methylglutaconyl-CoA hydratase
VAYELIRVERQGPVERVTLNRPEVRNALNEQVVAELGAWAGRASADGSLRAAVITGAGRVFCAGADIAWMSRAASHTEQEHVDEATAMAGMFLALDRLPFAVIARIQGAALGGGVGLAAVSDIVIAEEEAVFGFTEVKLGIIPAVISPYVLAKAGRSAARELFLTGARFPAARAREIGLAHAVVPAAELDVTVELYVTEILSSAPGAVGAAKRLVREVATLTESTQGDVLPFTAKAIAARRMSSEGREGLRAFLEKRRPVWVQRPE